MQGKLRIIWWRRRGSYLRPQRFGLCNIKDGRSTSERKIGLTDKGAIPRTIRQEKAAIYGIPIPVL